MDVSGRFVKVHAKRFAKLRLAYKRLKLLVKMCIFCVTAQKITTEYNQLFFGCCNQGLVKCLGCNISSAQISDQHIFYSHVFSKKIAKLIFTFSSYWARVGFFTAQNCRCFYWEKIHITLRCSKICLSVQLPHNGIGN